MKQVNFTHTGGFPLEQETLEKLQTAYRSELYEALKSHLSIDNKNDYILAHATKEQKGWAVIRQEDPVNQENQVGILYPINNGAKTNYLKTTRTDKKLIYGTGVSKTAYYDYEAEYTSVKYANEVIVSKNGDVQTVRYYNIKDFATVTDIKTIDEALKAVNSTIDTIGTNINVIKTNINTIETNVHAIEADVNAIETNIHAIEADLESYLPLNGSKAMKGDLDLGTHKLSKLDTKEVYEANVRATNFNFGSANLGRALVDKSNSPETKLTLNYNSDWYNTSIGGKVYLDNLNTSIENFNAAESSESSLLLIDNANQVLKSNNVLKSLLNRISKLENQPASTVPIGMIAIWGKTAPFPEGWEEYVPLRGRMPVGLDIYDSAFSTLLKDGGNKDKKLEIDEMPKHRFTIPGDVNENHESGPYAIAGGTNNDRTAYTNWIGNDQPFSILNPYRVVHFIEYTGKSSDKIPPTSPINLTVSNIGDTSLTLSWMEATDNIGVANYLVYKDNSNTPLAELGKDVLTYNVTGLSDNTSYSFLVRAKDEAGNISSSSNIVNVTTINIATVNPTVPTLQYAYYGGENMTLQWPNYIDSGTITYELYRSINGSGPLLLQTSTNTFYYDKLSNGLTYSYQIRINSNGYISPYSNTVTVTGRS